MSLESSLSIATSGLLNVDRQLAVVSQNVANASTPGYSQEVGTQQSMTASGQGMGVRTGLTARDLDLQLQAQLFTQNAEVAYQQTRQTVLQPVDAALGTVDAGNDLGSLLGDLQDQFTTLEQSPDSAVQQQQTVTAASELAQGINSLSSTYASARQASQDDLSSAVDTLNNSLQQIGTLSDSIMSATAAGQSTADLENQRDAVMQTVSQLLDVRFLPQTNGDMEVITPGGLSLPIHGQGNALTTSDPALNPDATVANGGVPGIMMGGVDVTAQLRGGRIGADINLRDVTLPTDQAELDEFAQGLASRFDAQGLTLFTDGSGAVPSGGGSPTQAGYIGFASQIQVNPAVAGQPSLVRDGTHSVTDNPAGASGFTPNPSGGPADFSTMIQRVLDYTFGADIRSGIPQPGLAVTGLGVDGSLSAPYSAPATLSSAATSLIGAQSGDIASAGTQLTNATAVQTSLQSRLQAGAGVNIDQEMSNMTQLQNAYSANAKVISTLQQMWTQLLAEIP
jgi:flagellar hook-associated protein 1 FlgK